ncbi:unnamed protein product [Schistosoma curassoni]|uniref:Uncharacterized protein n=1 Tax=Schistosoma curassoni TaxID=6186 RepID=A0A183JRL3_9TREM|nr:unnamed protein product [Schistosoma curassoni]
MSINSDQVASFIANANKLYLEELGLYTSRDRSNPIRTLTGNESSQFCGVIQQLRQPKEESSSLHLPSACNVSVTNINIPNLNFRDQQSEYMGMCLPRPHSSEGAGNHTFGSYMKSELSRGTPRCIVSKILFALIPSLYSLNIGIFTVVFPCILLMLFVIYELVVFITLLN